MMIVHESEVYIKGILLLTWRLSYIIALTLGNLISCYFHMIWLLVSPVSPLIRL